MDPVLSLPRASDPFTMFCNHLKEVLRQELPDETRKQNCSQFFESFSSHHPEINLNKYKQLFVDCLIKERFDSDEQKQKIQTIYRTVQTKRKMAVSFDKIEKELESPEYQQLMDIVNDTLEDIRLFKLDLTTIYTPLLAIIFSGNKQTLFDLVNNGSNLIWAHWLFCFYCLCKLNGKPQRSLKEHLYDFLTYQPGRNEKTVLEIFTDEQSKGKSIRKDMLYDYAQTSSDDTTDDETALLGFEEDNPAPHGDQEELSESDSDDAVEIKQEKILEEVYEQRLNNSYGYIKKYNYYHESCYSNPAAAVQPGLIGSVDTTMQSFLAHQLHCILYRGLHRSKRYFCRMLPAGRRPKLEEAQQLQQACQEKQLIMLFFDDAMGWQVMLNPTEEVAGSTLPLNILFEQDINLKHITLIARQETVLRYIRSFLHMQPEHISTENLAILTKSISQWFNAKFKLPYQNDTKKVSLSPEMIAKTEKQVSKKLVREKKLLPHSKCWLLDPERYFRDVLDYNSQITLQAETEKTFVQLQQTPAPSNEKKKEKEYANKLLMFIEFYIKHYAHVFGSDSTHERHCSQFNFQANPILSTSFKIDRSLKYASGMRSESGFRHQPHFRKTTGKAKHPVLGYLRVFLLDKTFVDHHGISVTELVGRDLINLGRLHRHEGEVLFRGSIPARFHYQDIPYTIANVSILNRPGIFNKKFIQGSLGNEMYDQFEADLTVQSDKAMTMKSWLFSVDKKKRNAMVHLINAATIFLQGPTQDKSLRVALTHKGSNICLYYPFSLGYAQLQAPTLNDPKDWQHHQQPTEGSLRDELFSTVESFTTSQTRPAIVQETPIPEISVIAREIFDLYFDPEGDMPCHGASVQSAHDFLHASRTAYWIVELYELIMKHQNFIRKTQTRLGTALNQFNPNDYDNIRILSQVAGLLHDAGREGDGVDIWERQSAELFIKFAFSKPYFAKMADYISLLKTGIHHKNNLKEDHLPQLILYEADVFEIIRVLNSRKLGQTFDIKKSCFHSLLVLNNAVFNQDFYAFLDLVIHTQTKHGDIRGTFSFTINERPYEVNRNYNPDIRMQYHTQNAFNQIGEDIRQFKNRVATTPKNNKRVHSVLYSDDEQTIKAQERPAKQ